MKCLVTITAVLLALSTIGCTSNTAEVERLRREVDALKAAGGVVAVGSPTNASPSPGAPATTAVLPATAATPLVPTASATVLPAPSIQAAPSTTAMPVPTTTSSAVPTPPPRLTPTRTAAPSSSGPRTLSEIDGKATLLADDGTYLGILSSNAFASDSVCNEFGTFGSAFSGKSVRNEFGKYGSEFSSLSAYNPFTSKPPAIIYDRRVIGYLTKNEFKSGAVDPDLMFAVYGCPTR